MKTLGQIAYEAFADYLVSINYQGCEIPLWDGVVKRLQLAWEVAAKAAVNEYVRLDMEEYKNALNVINAHAARNIYGSDK